MDPPIPYFKTTPPTATEAELLPPPSGNATPPTTGLARYEKALANRGWPLTILVKAVMAVRSIIRRH